MEEALLAAHSKKVVQEQATLVFLDETGLLLQPVWRRCWAPRGQPPVVRVQLNGRRKLSAIGALAMGRSGRVNCYLAFHPDRSVRQEELIAFLRQLLRRRRGKVVLVWDRLAVHQGRKLRQFLRRTERLKTYLLPPYAPELNPVEYLWAYLKGQRLANFCPEDLEQLRQAAEGLGPELRRRPRLLRQFVAATGLRLPYPPQLRQKQS